MDERVDNNGWAIHLVWCWKIGGRNSQENFLLIISLDVCFLFFFSLKLDFYNNKKKKRNRGGQGCGVGGIKGKFIDISLEKQKAEG